MVSSFLSKLKVLKTTVLLSQHTLTSRIDIFEILIFRQRQGNFNSLFPSIGMNYNQVKLFLWQCLMIFVQRAEGDVGWKCTPPHLPNHDHHEEYFITPECFPGFSAKYTLAHKNFLRNTLTLKWTPMASYVLAKMAHFMKFHP